MKYEDVRVGEWGDSDTSLDAGTESGSIFTGSAGGAFYNAALDLRNRLFSAAITKTGFKEVSGITTSDLEARNSEVVYGKDPIKKLSYRQVMSGTPPLAGTGNGWSATLRTHPVGGSPIGTACNANCSSAACAEIAVDTDTGEIEVLGLWSAVDTGRTIFKQGVLKEMQAGCSLMLWQALYAGAIYDPANGACISSQYTEALLPTVLDIKTGVFHLEEVESDDAAGPFGAHGIADACLANYSAIHCAIYNAIGKWVDTGKGSATPDRVLDALTTA
jgi:CO/xanthine dehydrogenase Mo-binding subunit